MPTNRGDELREGDGEAMEGQNKAAQRQELSEVNKQRFKKL